MSFQQWVVRGTQDPVPLPHWFTAHLAKFVVELAGSAAMASLALGALYLVAATMDSKFLAAIEVALGLPTGVATPLVAVAGVSALLLDRFMWRTLTDGVEGQ